MSIALLGEPLRIVERTGRMLYREVLSCGHYGKLADPGSHATRRKCHECKPACSRPVVALQGKAPL